MPADTSHELNDTGHFDQARSAEIVNARVGPGAEPRLREVIAIMVRHLHAAVKEAQLTSEEWNAAIQFLTETGRGIGAVA